MLKQIATELRIKESQVQSTVNLLDEGNTIPFIARYRKEVTGELDENVIRAIEERLNYLRNLATRKEEVIRIIDEQGKMTPELAESINKAQKLQEVEDLYRPYKQKRRTRATVAKEKGLEPLAQLIYGQEVINGTIEDIVAPYINPDLEVNTIADALNGAMDIIAEQVSDDAEIRKYIRSVTTKAGIVCSKASDKELVSPYQMYYEYNESVAKIPPHRILAINRGENEAALIVKIDAPVEKIIMAMQNKIISNSKSIFTTDLAAAIEDAYKRLIAPSIEREVRNELTEKAEEQAISVFSTNLRNLLLQPPVRGKVVLGVDPGFRTGCKLAVVDETGKVLEVGVMYPHPPQNKKAEAINIMKGLIAKYAVEIVAIGNGTASRESESLVAEMIKQIETKVYYVIVSEAGASVYSASKLAGEEFPQYDLSLRSAVSIARRLEDPLAELVKIEPKAIGVGQYQHDVNPKRLTESLGGVVESAVNVVGVDLNTASPSLLQYIAGIKPAIAKNIVAYREEQGKFKLRKELKKVAKLGDKTFVQCAGFLRIPGGKNPLENTPVHPESYDLAEKILAKVGLAKADINSAKISLLKQELSNLDLKSLAAELDAGLPTVKDIVEALQKPGRDPRDELAKPLLHTDVTSIDNLKADMILEGTVRNVVDFGAFVDIGVKHDGLVHISQLSAKYIKHPTEVVAVGDIVKVKVLAVDMTRERVSLSMRDI